MEIYLKLVQNTEIRLEKRESEDTYMIIEGNTGYFKRNVTYE